MLQPWHAEHEATEAFALACLGRADEAEQHARVSEAMTRCIEARGFAAAARAVSAARAFDASGATKLIDVADQLGIWDPVVCAVRSSPELADTLADIEALRPILAQLYERTLDAALSRRAGFRTRAARDAEELLSPRELEVLALLVRGLRNREIASALYIAESTAKVHVRHVLTKLGLENRTQLATSTHKRAG